MRPVLFEVWGLPIHTYGILVASAFAIGLWLFARAGTGVGIAPEQVADYGFWALLAALAGSRVLFLVVNWEPYWDACFEAPRGQRDCWRILKFWEGGLVFYGGLVGALVASVWFARRQKLRYLVFADAAAPSIALGHVLGRLGCFFAGCCYGKPGGGPFATTFPRGSLAFADWVRQSGMPSDLRETPAVHPTQLYEAFALLGIFALLLAVRRRKRFHGQVVLVYLLAYPVARSVLEVFRADSDRGFLFRRSLPALSRALGLPPTDPVLLSTAQTVSLLWAAGALTTLVVLRRRRAA